jgi:hypothetical protein
MTVQELRVGDRPEPYRLFTDLAYAAADGDSPFVAGLRSNSQLSRVTS